MTENYVQKLPVAPSKRGRICMIAGTALEFVALGFILLAAFLSLYFLIGLFVFFGLGVAVLQVYNNSPKMFEYDFSRVRIVITASTSINRKKKISEICFADVSEFGLFSDITEPEDILACENCQNAGVYFIKFKLNKEEKRLLFQPDTYLVSLINETLNSLKEQNEASSRQNNAFYPDNAQLNSDNEGRIGEK